MPAAALARPSTRQPRYRQLADDLRGAILGGRFPDGFPTESVLCAQYGVSRFTIREALRALQDEGLISRRRGSGTVIQPASARGGALHQPLSNVGEILQYARDTRVVYERQADSGLPPAIETQLGWTSGARWMRFHGLRSDADGRPLATTVAYLHEMLDPIVELIRPSDGAIFSQIERLAGIKVARVTQDIMACAADAESAATLDMAEGAAMLRIIRCYSDASGRIFEISDSLHPGDRFAYAMHIEGDG